VLDSLSADTDGAAIDPEVIDTARVQILEEPQIYAESHYFAQLRTLPGFWPKARHVWDRLFLPPSEMARLHAKSLGQGSLAAFYLARGCRLIGRYAQSTIGLLEGPPALLVSVRRRTFTTDC
jgi:hypothetical protein